MLEWYEILIIVVGALLLVYVLGLIVNLAFIVAFKRKINEHKKAITIVLTQKKEALINLVLLIEKRDPKLDPRFFALLQDIDENYFAKIYSPETKKARETLSYVRQELAGISNKSSDLQKNEEFKLSLASINSLDEQFRVLIASYNADIIGYNYWIAFKPYRYIFILNKTEKKDLIS